MSKTALITGGIGDLGFASAELLAREQGYRLVLLDWADESRAAPRLQELRDAGYEALFLRIDVSERAAVETALDQVWQEMGGLDYCLCTAAITGDKHILDFSVEEWQRHLDINLSGYFHVSQAVARRWVKEGKKGKLVFMGSWVQDVPYKLIGPYCVSKAGAWMLCRIMAMELGPYGITANCVAPGNVDAGLTAEEMRQMPWMRELYAQQIPLRRMQTAFDVAQMVAFTASPASDYTNGACFLTDGGCTSGAATPLTDKDLSKKNY
jgi:NAD(P)-dependent dehydrogenase (short-subunit alcohol dehydrogenase family)